MEDLIHQYVGIQNLRIHAFHGVYPEEALVGHWFCIDLRVEIPPTLIPEVDDLDTTLNYASLHMICTEVMSERADLLETVAYRIIRRIRKSHAQAGEIRIRIAKEHPAFQGGCDKVFVEISAHPE
ncbi:MAG: dihydroneopterin aldolase [Saprospiraceae bacterium]